MLPSDPTDPSGSATPATPAPVAEPGLSVPPARVLPGRNPGRVALVAALIVVTVLAGTALFLSGYSLGRQQATTPGTPAGEEQAFQPFWDAYHFVIENYAGGQVDQKTLIEGAIKGMIGALGDPYSSYLTSEEYRQSLQGISGEFEGIGAEITTKTAAGGDSTCATLGADCLLVVVAPIDGSPAQKAGVTAGDVITAVDGQSVDGLTVDQARDRIRGKKGTQVTLSVVRGSAAPIQITITRDVIVQKEVIARDLAGGRVGYIRVTGFSDRAADDFRAILATDIAKGEKKIVLDLRGDPGGFVTAARDIASQFIASGPIYWQKPAHGDPIQVDAKPDGIATDPSISVVVLIDRGSASASEIVAGALQDTKRATLVGEQSFGKGTVQQWQSLEDDSGGFRLTIAQWLTPNQRSINHTGLTPDIVVTVPANTPPGKDPVLDRALSVLGEASAAVPAG